MTKIKALKQLQPMDVLGSIINGIMNPPARSGALTTELPDITVDTCCAQDTETWETGIERKNIKGKWVIVQQYKNKEQAEKGHNDWVTKLTAKPDMKLSDINIFQL
jgi:hypothetical protein